MKKNLFLVFLLVLSAKAFSYEFDVILTKERHQIQCIILSESDEQIAYRMLDAETPQYTISKADILKIYRADQEAKAKFIETAKTTKEATIAPAPVLSTGTAELPKPSVEPEIIQSSYAESQKPEPSSSPDIADKDIIILKNNTKIECVISEVSKSEIRYKKVNYIDSPTFVESTDDILTVLFRDGSVQSFASSQKSSKKDKAQKNNDFVKNFFSVASLHINGEIGSHFTHNSYYIHNTLINVNHILNSSYEDCNYPSGGFDFDFSVGLRYPKFLFIGLGMGIDSEFANKTVYDGSERIPLRFSSVTFPLFADVRLYLPTKIDLNPFFVGQFGGYFVVSMKSIYHLTLDPRNPKDPTRGVWDEIQFNPVLYKNGYLMSLGLGFEYKYFQFSIGYRLMATNGYTGNYGFIKVGFCYNSRIKKNTSKNSNDDLTKKPERDRLPRFSF